MPPWSAYFLSGSVGASVLSVITALAVVVLPTPNGGRSSASGLGPQLGIPLLAGSIAALAAALTTHLAVSTLDHVDGDSSRSKDRGDGVGAAKSPGEDAEKDEKNTEKKDNEETVDDGKRWTKRQEVWSEEAQDWVERKQQADEEGADTDSQGRDKDTDKPLFIVKHRVMPKQPNSEGFTIVRFTNSTHIVDVLRGIIKADEDLFEDKASVDAKELFLAKSQIQGTLEALEAEKDGRKDEKEKEELTEEAPSDGQNIVASERQKTEAEREREQAPSHIEPVQPAELTNDTGAEPFEVQDDEQDEGGPKATLAYSELLERVDHIRVLLDFITEHFASIQAKLDRLLPKGMISYKLLWTVIKPGVFVKYTHKSSGEAAAFHVRKAFPRQTMAGEQYYVSGTYLDWQGEKFVSMAVSETIPQFVGLRKLSSLDCAPMNDSDRAALVERGKIYAKYAGPHYMHFTGALITPGPRPGAQVPSI